MQSNPSDDFMSLPLEVRLYSFTYHLFKLITGSMLIYTCVCVCFDVVNDDYIYRVLMCCMLLDLIHYVVAWLID